MGAAAGCRRDEPAGPSLEDQLRADTDVQSLFEIRDELTTSALAAGVTGRELLPVLRARDEKTFASLLGIAPERYAKLAKRLSTAREHLLQRYPGLMRRAMPRECPDCDVEAFTSMFGRMRARGPALVRAPRAVSCHYLPYVASLALCTGLGPVLYWPCTVVAVCTFCEGGWVETVCN